MADGRRMRRSILILAVTVTVVSILAGPAVAQEEPLESELEDPAPVDLGAYADPLRFEAPDGVTFDLGDGRYVDTIELRLGRNGEPVLINELDTTEYVYGIAEMPARWPMEALKAQAVAARTYAWYQIQLGTFQRRGFGYDICATVACQVFRGQRVVETPEVGHRWKEAVDQTAGEVLLYEGEPILARYFSTSGGRTRNNEEVFASEGPRPYLKGREDPDDAVSPLHTWQAVFTPRQFNEILSRGETLSATVPVARVDRIERTAGVADGIVVTGRDGTTREVTAGEFRRFVSDVARSLYPDDFPGRRSDGGRLPDTLPSSRYEVSVGTDEVVIDGSGWGHAVGLGQYGAMGKAERGLDYREILAFYYNGLEPQTVADLPSRIRVGLDTDVEEVVVRADGPFRIVAGESVITERGLGTWRVSNGADRTMRLQAPTGYGAPLVAADTAVSRLAPLPVEKVRVETVVNGPAELRFEVTDREGHTILERPLGIVEAGRHAMYWDLDGPEGQLPEGVYHAGLFALGEDGAERAGSATEIRIQAITTKGRPLQSLLTRRSAEAEPDWRLLPVVAAGLAGLAVGALGGGMIARRP